MPAPKKHPSVRARTNRAPTAAVLAPRRGRRPRLPEIVDWHPQVIEWWADVWASPMPSGWDKSDRHNVIFCAMLLQDFWVAESARDRTSALAEFRQHRKDLGLTPGSREGLEWDTEAAVEPRGGKSRGQRAGAKQPAAKQDPRLALVQ